MGKEIKIDWMESWKNIPDEARTDIIKKLKKDMAKNRRYWNKQPYNRPEKIFEVSELGDLHIQWMFDRYTALRLMQYLPLFHRAYDLMVERGNFSRRNAFGEMHGDNYMWVEKCSHSKIIVHEAQSFVFLFMQEGIDYPSNFHIRELEYKHNYPAWRRQKLKQCSLKTFRATDFKRTDKNPALHFGDARDEGYIGTMSMMKGYEKVDGADSHFLFAASLPKYWKIYLDDLSQLE